jgi:hypothetical protein
MGHGETSIAIVQYWKSSTLVKCLLAVKEVFMFFLNLILIILLGGAGHFTKMCSTKFSPITMKASPKICLPQNTVVATCK